MYVGVCHDEAQYTDSVLVIASLHILRLRVIIEHGAMNPLAAGGERGTSTTTVCRTALIANAGRVLAHQYLTRSEDCPRPRMT